MDAISGITLIPGTYQILSLNFFNCDSSCSGHALNFNATHQFHDKRLGSILFLIYESPGSLKRPVSVRLLNLPHVWLHNQGVLIYPVSSFGLQERELSLRNSPVDYRECPCFAIPPNDNREHGSSRIRCLSRHLVQQFLHCLMNRPAFQSRTINCQIQPFVLRMVFCFMSIDILFTWAPTILAPLCLSLWSYPM